jgi:predicted nuclease with TOPRIM domain
VQATQALKKE